MAAHSPAKPTKVSEKTLESQMLGSARADVGWRTWLQGWKQVLVAEVLTLLEHCPRSRKRNAQ